MISAFKKNIHTYINTNTQVLETKHM